MKIEVRKEINISPSQMAKKIVESGNLFDAIEQYMIDTLIEDYDISSDDASDAIYNLPNADFIEIIEAIVNETKKSLN